MDTGPSRIYQRTQIGWSGLAFTGIVLIVILSTTYSAPLSVKAPAVVICLACAVFLATLTVRVDGGALELWFTGKLYRRRLALSEIESAQAIRMTLLGWGIRTNGRDVAYIAGGRRAVELRLTNGKRVIVSTDDPQGLCDAIKRARLP